MNLQTLLQHLIQPFELLKTHIHLLLIIFAVVWAVNLFNWIFLRSLLNIFGIFPRRVFGLLGVVFSPILHGNLKHLLFNSIPAFVLMAFVLTTGLQSFIAVTVFIALVGGILVWIFGRPALHIGMSGLICGYFAFLLVNAFERPSLLSIVLVVVAVYYFGSIFLSLFPKDKETSWEGHLFGFAAGIVMAFYYVPLLTGYFWLITKFSS